MPTPDLRPLMSIAEVADRLGVTVRHIRRLVNERRIPFIKWGHLLRFDPAEVDQWIETCRQGVAPPSYPGRTSPVRHDRAS